MSPAKQHVGFFTCFSDDPYGTVTGRDRPVGRAGRVGLLAQDVLGVLVDVFWVW